ncbi:NAD-P-binding protein [Abortiporus biennis]|nr:NAD-P-binding protein [Abortiporus biennis]
MPSVTSGKVLVTGANGFIALWVVKTFLEKGFSVRGTVRSEAKVHHLKETFKSFGDKLEVVVVEDITKDGAFDEAVKGIDAIEHTASPFHFNATDPQELIVPAVAGTVGVLKSALKYGTNVKRITVLSSCAAILEVLPNPKNFSEEDWAKAAIQEIEEKGKEASVSSTYRASKTLAEKAAWDFVKEHKGELKWDLVVLNPPYVFGPTLHEVASVSSLNTSSSHWYQFVLEQVAGNDFLASEGSCYVDVRDLALAHVYALEKEAAGGNRFIVCAAAFKWQDIVNSARKFTTVSSGNQSYKPENAVHMITYDTSKAAKLLGMKYLSLDETTKAILDDFKEKGFWPKKN